MKEFDILSMSDLIFIVISRCKFQKHRTNIKFVGKFYTNTTNSKRFHGENINIF